MNRIYNVIWSKTKKCYVVVSEIVKSSGGKVKSLHTGKTYTHMSTVMAVAALLAGVNITSVNAAAIMIDGVNAGYATAQNGGNKWSYLYNYNNPGNMNALDGSATTGYYSGSALNGISIGHNTKIQESSDPTYYSGVAIGDYAQATGGLSFSLGNYAQSTKPSAMAIGTASLSSGFNSLAMMRQSAATGNFSTAIGTTSWASGTGSFALGYSAQSKGDQSIAIGAAEPITVAGSGNEPSAAYNGNTNTVTEGARSLAFGTKARTTAAATDSMAFGSNAKTKAANAVAMGNSSRATGTDSFAFGNTASAAGTNAIAMGRTAQASKANAIALGGQAQALEANALAIGSTAAASKAGTMAIGTASKASSNNSTAIGNGAEVTGENSMALGSGAKISSNNSIALGAGTEFNDPLVSTYAAFTNEMNPAEAGVVAVGNSSTPRRIVNVAGGQNDNDAATIKQLRYVNNNLAMTIAGPTYTGYEANGSTYKAPDFNIKNSTYHTVKEAVEAAQTNFFSAKGTSADANYDNKGATGTNATAAGVRASAAGNFGTALGADATATSEKGTALGYNAKVTEDDGVALGSNSVANTAAGVAGYDVSAADNRANKYTALTGNVATSTLGAVSVGQNTSVGNETRQITNLAAGTKDTDAVNVAQLRNVNLKIAGNTNDNNGKNDVLLDKQTLTVKGDGTYVTTKANNQTIDVTLTNDTKDKIDNAANKDLSNITNVGKKNITALGTIVEAGNNVTIPAATVDTTTGQKTYTVNAMDTKVSLGISGLMTLTGGTPDVNGVRNYTVDVDPTKVAKTDLSNINNDGKTVIREEAQKAVKVIAGQNTTVTEGTDGTYKTYAVNVASAGDYRLVENSAAADKAYTVTGNKVDLKVKDDKSGTTNTVTIKDIASKTEFDKLNDRAVKYDVDGSGNVDKSKVTYEGPTYNSTNKSGGTHVTNVAYATGNDGSEAVNVDYLTDKIKDSSEALINKGMKFDANVGGVQTNKLGSTVKVQGEGTEADANYSGKNIKTFIGQDSSGNTTIDVKMNKNLEVETVTATGANGKDGKIGINGKDGVTTNLSITRDGKPGVDGAAGTTTTRIVYEKPDGTTEEVATLNDGLRFKGDMGPTSNVKLNKQVDVTGGVTNAADLATGNNIGVTSAAVDANGNAKLQLQLAKDITGLKSVTATDTVKAGTATVGNQTATDNKGGTQTGNFVTGLDNTNWNMTDPVFVPGRAATEDQLKTVSDAVKAASASASDYRLIGDPANTTDGSYKVTNNQVDLKVKDDKSGTTNTVTIKDIASKTELDKLEDRAVKYDLDGTGNVDKSKVTYEGPAYNSTNKSGGTHVTNVAYATGNDGSEAVNVDYLTDKIKDSSDALINKGLKFDANVGGVQTNKLGSTVTVKGEGTAADANYSGENIKTFIEQDTAGNTTINVKMNKDIIADSIKVNKDGRDGKDGVSITGPTGVASQDGNNGKVGITGADGKDAVSISGKDGVGHIGLTGPVGTNGKDGSNGIDMSVKNGYDDAAKGVKGEKGVDGVDGITRIVYTDNTGEHQVATMDDGMLYGGDTGTVIKKKLNNQVNVKGGITAAAKLSNEDNIGVVADGTDTLMLRLAKDLKGLNSATFNNGTDGNTVVNGGGLTINDAAGNPLTSVTKDGVVITDGPSMTKDGIDASDKKITNVADGTIGAGSKDAVNGGQLHTVVEDLKTKGFGLTAEDGASVKKSLGDTVTVKGDGTNITTSVDNGAVKVALARDLNVDTVTANTVTTGDTKMDTNGVTIKDGANEATKLTKDGLQINDGGNKAVTIDKDGLTIENGPKVTKDGINAGDKKITNVEDGTIAAGSKDAVNGGQLHTAMEDIKAQGFGLKSEDGQSVKKPLGEVIDLKGDGNIKTSVDGTAIKMSLNDTITLGTDPAKQVKVDGSTGTITTGNGANQVTIDGSTGSVTAGNTVKAGDVIMGNQNSGGQNGNFVTGLDNKTWNPNNPVAVTGRAATEDQLKAVNDDFNEKAKNGRVFQGDQAGNDGKVVRGLGDTMNLKGGADVNRLSDNNLAVVKNTAGDGYDIKLAKDLNLKDGSTTYTKTVPGTNTTIPYTVDTKVDGGGITITPSINGQPVPGHTVSLTENGLNNGNNTITNVAPGINGTDAVNVNQLRNAMHSVDGKIADVGAASAAMAGLKPLQYDPLEPTQVLAAVGNYKGSTAAAIGIAHYTNESTMLHMGVSLGGHDNMVNAGVSYKFGTSDAKKAIPARYKAGPISSAYVMQDEVAALKAENLRMKQRDEELSAKYEQVQRDNEEMKAQIAMLMKQAGLTK